MDESRSAEVAQWFWGVQEIPDVLDRWAATIPRERVHLVTVPPPGSDPQLLWQRFAGVFGIDPDELATTNRANASLGVPESSMVRRLNARLNDVLPRRSATATSCARSSSTSTSRSARARRGWRCPPTCTAWASSLGRSWVSELALRGYDVVGDLDDLVPDPEPKPFVDPDDRTTSTRSPRPRSTRSSIMTIEAARLRDVEIELHGVIEDLMGQLDRFHAHPQLPGQGAPGRARRDATWSRAAASRPTGGCAAAARGRRSGRSSRSSSRRCPRRPARRRPAPAGPRWWRSACRRPW